jgi:D-cysteine desulfhydrase
MTFGGTGTNHGLATTLYAREQGLRTVLLLLDQPFNEHVRTQIGRFYQARAVVIHSRTVPRTAVQAALAMARYADWRHGRLPYFLPTGGSSPLGVVGYVNAGLELADQVAAGELPEPAHIIVPLGSGGTVAGLLLGLRLAGLRSRLLAVLVTDLMAPTAKSVAKLANRTARLLRRRGASLPDGDVRPEDVNVLSEWMGEGYGHPTEAAARAEELVRETEGLELEGVYTAKTVAAILELVESGRLREGPVLYWHTHNALPLPFEAPTADDIARMPRTLRNLMAAPPR